MNKTCMMLLAATLILGSCSEKNEQKTTAKAVKVKTMTVQPTVTDGQQGYSGTIEEQNGSSLSFASVGTLKSVSVSEGQMVRQGQLIATIDETSLQSAYEAALAAKEQALDAEERMRLLHDAGSLQEIKWIEVQTQVRQALSAEKIAKKALTDSRLYAPFSGYIAEKQAEAGQSVAPGVPIVKLVRIDQVKVSISVPEEEIAQIRKGQQLQVKASALGDKTFEAKVTEKGVTADALSRSYEVKAIINNPQHELLPGMIAEVRFSGAEVASLSGHEVASLSGHEVTSPNNLMTPKPQNLMTPKPQNLLLPAEIIQIDADNRPFVWRVAEGKALKTDIILGQNIGDAVQIVDGLKAGDKVICGGQQKVSNGMEVSYGTEE